MTRRALILSAAGVAGLLVIGTVFARVSRAPDAGMSEGVVVSRPELDTAALAPEGVRVRVRVLNSTDRSGLARRATQRLRDHGYDVVDYGNRSERASATQVQTSPGQRAIGERVARALGGGSVSEAEAPLPYADVLVILGPDWQPPPQPLRP